MPRGSTSGKRQQGSSTSHSRHDNGLVAPGKRAPRKKSQGQLDGKPRPADSAAPTATPSSNASGPAGSSSNANANANANANGTINGHVYAAVNGSSIALFNGNGNGNCISNGDGNGNGMAKLPNVDAGMGVGIGACADGRLRELPHRSSVGALSVASSTEDSMHSAHHANGNGIGNDNGTTEPRQIDVNAAKYGADVHRDSGPLDLAVGVLHALPLHDTLAILLILMHVHPFTLSLIYSVFAWLTFAPPLMTSSGINIHLAELLDWHTTMPSLVTVLCVDVLTLLFWLFLWPAVQQAILDLAKPVIAATLGGGTASRTGRSSRVSLCFAIMIAHHCWKNSRWRMARLLQVLPPPWRLSPDPDDPMELSRTNGTKPGLFTIVLGIHILMQGVVRYIREWYIRRERSSSAQTTGPGDPEAGKPAAVSGESTDSSVQVADSDPSHSNTTNTSLTSKRRRKQSAQVRLQQPLWAALASTKVVMVKEYELSHATSESAGTNATDIHNLGNAPFDREARRIWISYIGCDEVSFDTSPFPDDYPENQPAAEEKGEPSTPSSAIDHSKPFYIRVNKARWLSTRIVPTEEQGEAEDFDEQLLAEFRRPEGTKWTGDIYGLRPMSKYVCEFVDSHSDRVLYSTAVTTGREPTKSAAASANGLANGAANGQRRSHSPVTTLKTSIKAAEAKLVEERGKLKTLRKEWKSKIDGLKKENKAADNAINSAGGTDDRHRQKIRQQETQKSQVAQELFEVDAELKAFDASPGGLADRRKQAEKEHSSEKSEFEAAQRAFKSHSTAVNSAVKSKEGDRQQLQSKRNKIAARIAKVDTEHASVMDANKRGLNEAERRKTEREIWQHQVAHAERHLNNKFNALQAENSLIEAQVHAANDQLSALKAQMAGVGALGQVQMQGQAQGQAQGQGEQHHQASQFQYGPSSAWNPNPTVHAHSHAHSHSHSHPHYPPGVWPPTSSESSVMPSISAPGLASGLHSGSMWPVGPTTSGLNLTLSHAHPHSHSRARARSSSMLSDASSLAQSSSPDDEPQPSQSQVSVYRQGSLGLAFGMSPSPKGPVARARKPSVGEVSGRSSRSGASGSGSGSGASVKDPTSPT